MIRRMRPIRSISVLMPTWQGIEFLKRVLEALANQEIGVPWDFLAIDSGSSDGTWELLHDFAARFPVPFRRERIDQVEFDHGDTRNLLAAKSRGDLLVFLTQDAIPSSPAWLATLARNFDDPRVGAAYCRNVPRLGASILTRVFSANDIGYSAVRREACIEDPEAYARMSAQEKRILYNFNDVASAIRRELWERHPFPRTWFGEDLLMSRGLLEAGFTVVYDTEATVEHSHDYGVEETRARAKIDARFNAEWLDRTCVASRSDARLLTERQLDLDRVALKAARVSDTEYGGELERAARLRAAAFEGLHEGGLTKKRYPSTKMLERTDLSILYVVHGFAPDTWAGTEIYTQNLAAEMQRRGHRVTILARVPADRPESEGGPRELSILETTFQGLRVLRLVHRLQHENLRASYRNEKIEAAFRRLLARERFDVVHFQHLIHLSSGLVHVAREHGLPTLITCHDYWAVCARVQLIRPDSVRCEENMGSGCFLCVKEFGLGHIARMKRLDRVASPLLDAVASGARRGHSRMSRAFERWEGFADMRARHDEVAGAYKAADLRISPSRFLRRKLVDTAGFDAHTFLFSDNGMRTDHVRALAKKKDELGRMRFGFVGSLVWYKGGEVMLRAMQLLRGARAVLNVHGDFKPERDKHHAALKALAGDNVSFRGRFDNARLSEVYSEIDVLLVPSIWFENSPITIHEAFLTRTPVVASDIGGMKEFVRDGVDGLHFKAGDAADLARVLRRFVDEADLVGRLSRDFQPVKTIEEDAAAMEFRYRALACTVRRTAPQTGPLVAHRGIDATARHGPVEVQGADMLLLRPDGAAVEYDIEGAGGGARVICVEQFVVGAESSVRLGGRVLVDDVEIGRIPITSARGKDEVVRHGLEVELDLRAKTLRLETLGKSDGGETYLRVQRVSVLTAPLRTDATEAGSLHSGSRA
jgi:glycosyltransferase involved in cell wall biosynthesis